MTFYRQLSRVYDFVFPENRAATEFLAKDLSKGSRILDLACGTGSYTYALTQKGHSATGIDLDEKMIKQTKKKYSDSLISFFTGDMLEIDTLFSGSQFDMIFCIGNSLVHLPDRNSIKILAEKAYGLLTCNGLFIAQIVNFNRIIKYGIESLPSIENKNKGITLIRNYVFNDKPGYVSFNTELYVNGEKKVNTVRLMALKSEELIYFLEESGFSRIKLYGGYDESDYSDESPAAIVRAVK